MTDLTALRANNAREDVAQAAALLQRCIDRADALHALDAATLENDAAIAYTACASLRQSIATHSLSTEGK